MDLAYDVEAELGQVAHDAVMALTYFTRMAEAHKRIASDDAKYVCNAIDQFHCAIQAIAFKNKEAAA